MVAARRLHQGHTFAGRRGAAESYVVQLGLVSGDAADQPAGDEESPHDASAPSVVEVAVAGRRRRTVLVEQGDRPGIDLLGPRADCHPEFGQLSSTRGRVIDSLHVREQPEMLARTRRV